MDPLRAVGTVQVGAAVGAEVVAGLYVDHRVSAHGALLSLACGHLPCSRDPLHILLPSRIPRRSGHVQRSCRLCPIARGPAIPVGVMPSAPVGAASASGSPMNGCAMSTETVTDVAVPYPAMRRCPGMATCKVAGTWSLLSIHRCGADTVWHPRPGARRCPLSPQRQGCRPVTKYWLPEPARPSRIHRRRHGRL